MIGIEDNKFCRLWIVWLLAAALLSGGCKADKTTQEETVSTQAAEPSEQAPDEATVIKSACDKILTGDFKGAGKVIEKAAISSKRLEQLAGIINEYESIDVRRKDSKNDTYKEQIDEFEKLYKETNIEDVNNISELFLVITNASEYAEKEQKQALLEKPFVKQIIEKALRKAGNYEADGKWIEAYTGCYYWLEKIYEDNSEYKDHAEELYDKAMIELSLKDNICETSAERHEGVKAEMLVAAVKALHHNYVSKIDYGRMAQAGIKRSLLLGDVLAKADDKLAYQVDDEKVAQWSVELEVMAEELEELSAVTGDKFVKIFGDVLVLNSITIDIPQEVVVAQFSEASLDALDPFTNIVWPSQVPEFDKSMTQEFTGIGVEISKATGVLKVVSLLPDTPAYNTPGLDADDTIVAVNGEPTVDMPINCAVSRVTGPKGTDVVLTVRHAGQEEKTEDITITRDRIIVPTIRGWQRTDNGRWIYFIDQINGISYLRITGFTETTARDMEKVLNETEAGGLKGLILDLRFNNGGYYKTAAAVVNMFVDKGLIVKSRPRRSFAATSEWAKKKGTHPNYPLVILINKHSASASEIVAGALHDVKYKRATLVGERSHGKGLVQTIVPFPGGDSQLKYTMAYYYLPSNQPVKNRHVAEKENRKDWGIAPDVEVKLRTNELRRMLEAQRANDVLARTERYGTGAKKRYSIEETLKADPQLAIGVLVLKSKMIQTGWILEFESADTSSIKTQAAG